MDKQVTKALTLAKTALSLKKNKVGEYEHEPMEVDCIMSVLRGEAERAIKLEKENERLQEELDSIKSTLRKISTK